MSRNIFQRIIENSKENPGLASGLYGIVVTILIGIIPFFKELTDPQKLLLASIIVTIGLNGVLLIIVSISTKNIDARLSIEKKGFIYINEYDLFKTLTNSIKSAQTNILVIGDGYSKKRNNKYERESKNYFLSIENKIKSDRAFSYKRITSNEITKYSHIYNHIVNSYTFKNENFKLSYFPYFINANTFVIVDDHTLILNAIHKDVSE